MSSFYSVIIADIYERFSVSILFDSASDSFYRRQNFVFALGCVFGLGCAIMTGNDILIY